LKKDTSGKLLFILGFLLIGVSVFNIFKDPINNQYYKIKRQFSKVNSTPVPTLNLPGEKNDTSPVLSGNDFLPIESDLLLKTLIEEENSQEEGFLPVNVEITDGKVATPQKTREYDVIPVRISIPTIDLTADIINATQKEIVQGEKTYIQWSAPDEFAVGWHFTSSFLGVPGNTVLNGHHNVFGKVFEHLDQLVSGDEIFIYGNDLHIYEYVVSNTMILAERDVSLDERLENARWILPSEDERITLITCWPYFSNTHRLIIVARPQGSEPIPVSNERN
jgi:LPXTG-site transpeptidase (sortase) family protein